jgi:glycosyltransferase involved in cell wall biosynthesis
VTAIRLLVAGDPAQYTGGYIYDARIAEVLTRAGRQITTIGLAGRFPDADSAAARALDQALADGPDGGLVIVDGLVLGGLPGVAARHAERLHLIALIHHPLADESGLDEAVAERLRATERQALSLAQQVVTTSQFTRRRLIADYGVDPALLAVIEPGVDKPAAPARRPTGMPRLLCVASLVPRKGHTVLIDALAQLVDLDWYCDCIGDAQRDPACTRNIRAASRNHGLAGRIHLVGSQPPETLASAYQNAWLFVLPSYYEGYGMVISEALAYGLPVVTTTGGALVDTLPQDAGIAVPPGDAAALAAALRRLLRDAQLHTRLALGARKAAASLPGWDVAGAQFAALLNRLEPERA